MKLVRHLKSGRIYRILYDEWTVDCTNSRDGLPVVVYTQHPQLSTTLDIAVPRIFVREKAEFEQKFEPLQS